MSASKSPSRIIDGPYAGWGALDETCKISLANNGTIQLGQPMMIDVTQLGPDQNVPNNASSLPQCEYVVASTSANAGPVFGVVSGVPGAPVGVTGPVLTLGVPTWTNKSGSTLLVTLQVRQQGWGYVLAGTAAIGQTGGNSILVGSTLITNTAQTFAIQGTGTIASTVGTALGTAINTNETIPGAGLGPGVISIIPNSIVGIVPPALVLIDSLASGVQETVSVGSISYPTFSVALANAHPAGFKITGPNTNPGKNTVLISTVGAGKTYAGLVATWINLY